MAAPPAAPAPPEVRHITSWIRRRPGNLDADEQARLKDVRAACPHLDALQGHVKAFAEMMTGRHGERLDAWIAAVRADDLPHLHSFANGLERDHAAVLNGLTLSYNPGAVEGKVCKIKFLKRLMFGGPASTSSERWPSGTAPQITQRDRFPQSEPEPAKWRQIIGAIWRRFLRGIDRVPARAADGCCQRLCWCRRRDSLVLVSVSEAA
jgi:hypothetical protein